MCTLSLLLAESTRFLIQPFFDLPDEFNQSVLPTIWENGVRTPLRDLRATGSIIRFLDFIWIHSFFLLGGCRWYKHAFWKTLGLMIVAWLLFITILANSFSVLVLNMEDILVNISFSAFDLIAILVFSLLILLNWWISYKLFTRSQVIQPKFRL